MNFQMKMIGWNYRAKIERKKRGFYTVKFCFLSVDPKFSRKYISSPKYYAEVVRTSGYPREWHINIKNMNGDVVYHSTEFYGLMETCEYARFWLMELEGVSNEG